MSLKTTSLAVILIAMVGTLQWAEAILSKPKESKDFGKSTESTKKSDSLEAQASHSHSVYGGYGENGLGGFGESGFGGGYRGDVGFGGGGGGYGGHGGYEDHHHGHHDHDHHHHHDHHGNGYEKALAIKGLLVPLAGVALLGAAAAFVSNPILLQLGVISGSYVGGRRRRDAEQEQNLNESAAKLEAQARLKEIQTLERFMAQVPKEQMFSQEKKLMANYLSCSGTTEEACLERLACELHGPGAQNMPEETRVMSIVTNEIFSNELVPFRTKERMAEAVRRGKEGDDCSIFHCSDLEALIRQKEERGE